MDDPGPVSGIFISLYDTQGQGMGWIKWLSRVSFLGATIIPVTPGVSRCKTGSKFPLGQKHSLMGFTRDVYGTSQLPQMQLIL